MAKQDPSKETARTYCVEFTLEELDLAGAAICAARERVLDFTPLTVAERVRRVFRPLLHPLRTARLLTRHEQERVPTHQAVLRKLEQALTGATRKSDLTAD